MFFLLFYVLGKSWRQGRMGLALLTFLSFAVCHGQILLPDNPPLLEIEMIETKNIPAGLPVMIIAAAKMVKSGPAGIVRNILEDKKGQLWFGTADGGVCRYDGQSLITL